MNKTKHTNVIIYDNGKGKTITFRMHTDNIQITFYYNGEVLETFWVGLFQLLKAFNNKANKDWLRHLSDDSSVIEAPLPAESNAFMRFNKFEFKDLGDTIREYYKLPKHLESGTPNNQNLQVKATLDNVVQAIKIDPFYEVREATKQVTDAINDNIAKNLF